MNNIVFSTADATSAIVSWLAVHGVAILAIVVFAVFVRALEGPFVERLIRKAVRKGTPEEEKLREDTLIRIAHGIARVGIWLVAALMVLSEAGINIGPLLAAAGVAGLAIGFGGQYLIRDLLAGFFIIIENQYRVGDVVCLDSTCGLVEDVSVRMATLRDLDGTVHHVPHGTVQRVSNLSKEFARINLDVGVSYSSDLERVIACVNRVGHELAQDKEWKEHIIEAPQFSRVNDFADSAVMIKILGDTKPLQQWAVTGELRKRLKIAFDKEGIEIPFPQRTIHQAK
ncbi:MAG: mechanosensitive ion channel family protein [Patescibacteria group bacterium]|nr:mechanosensitive ion channel family protein [Patescibacteria group bacterium]